MNRCNGKILEETDSGVAFVGITLKSRRHKFKNIKSALLKSYSLSKATVISNVFFMSYIVLDLCARDIVSIFF